MNTLSTTDQSVLEDICAEADVGRRDAGTYQRLVEQQFIYKTLGGYYRATRQGRLTTTALSTPATVCEA